MFSHNYDKFNDEIKRILKNTLLPDFQETSDILEKSRSEVLSLEELAKLLEIGKHEETKKQVDLIRNFVYARFRRDNNVLKHISPVYLSSHCIDRCGYCNYSVKRKNVERTRLDLEQLVEEVNYVVEAGNHVIEFTLATDPDFSPKKLASYISKAKGLLKGKKGSGILLCSDYFSREDYESLKLAGLWGMVQWDETLDKEKFQKWHQGSPRKSRFLERIDNHDRAIQAGLQVATGCLFGLSDYSYDVLMQIAKARYLEQRYEVKPFVFGTPRLKPIAGKILHPKDDVTDRQYELALMVYKIAEPQIARWLQTRETPELNLRNMLDHDIYTYECGEVKPGGYKINKSVIDSCKGGQFKVNELTKEELESRLRKLNFSIDYAWVK